MYIAGKDLGLDRIALGLRCVLEHGYSPWPVALVAVLLPL